MHISARNTGFTLVELLIVIALITILSGVLVPSFSQYISNQNVKLAQETVVSDLYTALNRALSGVGATNQNLKFWGISFTANSPTYTFISCGEDALGDPDCSSYINSQTSEQLPNNIVVRTSVDILFSLQNGNAVTCSPSNCSVRVGPSTGDSGCMEIIVNGAGFISKGTASSCI